MEEVRTFCWLCPFILCSDWLVFLCIDQSESKILRWYVPTNSLYVFGSWTMNQYWFERYCTKIWFRTADSSDVHQLIKNNQNYLQVVFILECNHSEKRVENSLKCYFQLMTDMLWLCYVISWAWAPDHMHRWTVGSELHGSSFDIEADLSWFDICSNYK